MRRRARRGRGRLSGAALAPPHDPPLLEAFELERAYGPVLAVAGIDIRLEAGDFLTVFGPNGAGKTSLLGLVSGALRPTRGRVLQRGMPRDFGAVEWRGRIGVLSHRGYLYGHLSARENLRFWGRLHGLDELDPRVDERLEQVGLSDRADTHARELSHGMRQRLALARALLHDPELVLLDEPFTGLDPSAAAVLRGVLESLRDGRRGVVMVTHNLLEGLAISTRVAIQVRGRIAWSGSPDEMRSAGAERHYHAVVGAAA